MSDCRGRVSVVELVRHHEIGRDRHFLIGRVERSRRQRLASAVAVSVRTFASYKMKNAAELAVGVSSAGFEFDRGRRRHLLFVA